MDRTYLFTVLNTLVMLNIQHSQIGGTYPRLFIEVAPEVMYVNVDLSLPAIFKMPIENWHDWLTDAVKSDDLNILKDIGLSITGLEDLIKELKEKEV